MKVALRKLPVKIQETRAVAGGQSIATTIDLEPKLRHKLIVGSWFH